MQVLSRLSQETAIAMVWFQKGACFAERQRCTFRPSKASQISLWLDRCPSSRLLSSEHLRPHILSAHLQTELEDIVACTL